MTTIDTFPTFETRAAAPRPARRQTETHRSSTKNVQSHGTAKTSILEKSGLIFAIGLFVVAAAIAIVIAATLFYTHSLGVPFIPQ